MVTFSSGEEFLRVRRRYAIRCAVLDVALGDMSGFDLEDRLAGEGASIPIQLITAHDGADLGPRLERSRALGFVQIPLDTASLLAAIKKVLGRPDA